MAYQISSTDSRHPDMGVDVRADSLGLDASINGVRVLADIPLAVATELARRILEITTGEDTP